MTKTCSGVLCFLGVIGLIQTGTAAHKKRVLKPFHHPSAYMQATLASKTPSWIELSPT